MKVKVVQCHPGDGAFPTFSKGTAVKITGEECAEFGHWFPCKIDGYATYIPEIYLADGILIRDYNPTELVQGVGDILDVKEIVNAWLYAANENGTKGWIPAEAVVSRSINF